MSAFLGPIHYWLYNKIILQEKLTKSMLKDAPEIYDSLASICGSTEMRPLEEVIDTSNIHGWLQAQILIAEKRYANGVHLLMSKKSVSLEQLQEKALLFGKEYALKGTTAPELYKEIQDLLLDGMPCDHVNMPVDQENDKVVWKRTADLHSSHWSEVGADGNIYYTLRSALLKGMLEPTSYHYIQNGDLCEISK